MTTEKERSGRCPISFSSSEKKEVDKRLTGGIESTAVVVAALFNHSGEN
jgi:hypothetical protein